MCLSKKIAGYVNFRNSDLLKVFAGLKNADAKKQELLNDEFDEESFVNPFLGLEFQLKRIINGEGFFPADG